ncbi:hypothetical protein ABPG75_008936 [Micractinium tetrahymenae]
MFVDMMFPGYQGLAAGPGLSRARQQYEQESCADRAAFGENDPRTQLSKHNLAEALTDSDPAEAERLHRELLAFRERAFGPENTRTAITLNSLGSLCRKRGALEEAEALLRRALAVREAAPGEAFDAAVTRDELACVLQAAGRKDEARAVRLRAGTQGLICSHAPCSKTAGQAGAPLKECARCHAIWYCSPACQRADWTANHRAVCCP